MKKNSLAAPFQMFIIPCWYIPLEHRSDGGKPFIFIWFPIGPIGTWGGAVEALKKRTVDLFATTSYNPLYF